jgi:MscS family membrane protein
MPEISDWFRWIDPEWVWVMRVFVVVLITAFASFFVRRLLNKLAAGAAVTELRWDDVLFNSLKRPVAWAIWIVGLDLAADVIYTETGNVLFTYSDSMRNIGVLLCIAWFFLGAIRELEQDFAERDHFDRSTVLAIGKLTRVAVIVTSMLVILQTLGYSISGVLAMGGIGGIAIGFAAKDMLSNFFGGLMIYFDRPFSEGDWIRSPDRNIEGTVETIGWRMTVIRNFESRPLYVPNSVFSSIVVENPSRMANRRLYETIGLRYSDLEDMEKIVDQVRAMLIEHPEIDETKTMMVNFNEFSDSSVDFFIYCFTKTTQWVKFHQVKQEVMLRIADIIAANQASIAFPTSTIHIADPVTVENS